jgi:hypothetical protein
VTVHVEASRHLHRVLQELGNMKTRAGNAVVRGVALNPGTPSRRWSRFSTWLSSPSCCLSTPGGAASASYRRRSGALGPQGSSSSAAGAWSCSGSTADHARQRGGRRGDGRRPDRHRSAVFDGGDAGANLRQMAATRPAGVA